MAKRKKKCPEFENHERWLVAFADMMTLLFALFVVLYAMASVNISKLEQVSESVVKAFGIKDENQEPEEGPTATGPQFLRSIFQYIQGDTSRVPLRSALQKSPPLAIQERAKQLAEKIARALYGTAAFPDAQATPQERTIQVSADKEGVRISLLASKFFAPGEYTIQPEGKKALDAVADALKGEDHVTRIEGHTDDLPFFKDGMTNWELSALRATSVTRYFIDNHAFPPNGIYAAGYGPTKPRAPNNTPEGRAVNRRVDLMILYKELIEDQPLVEDPIGHRAVISDE